MQSHRWVWHGLSKSAPAAGKSSFVKRAIMGRTPKESSGGIVFTEPHGTAFADMNGDGIPDLIVGKRLWSHLDERSDQRCYLSF
jgi:hypothetical protein